MKQNSCREDKAKIMDNIEEPPDETRHHKRATQSRQRPNRAEEKVQRQQQRDSASGHTGNARPVHFALLPGPYEPLVEEDDAKTTSKQERKAKNKKKYKKYRKNVGKALRFGWRCLVIGLQGFAAGYTSPLTAATTLVPDLHGTRA